MDFRLMALNIRQFVPMLSIPVIKQRINVRYQQIIGLEDWEFLNSDIRVNLIEVTTNTSSQSCNVTYGSTQVIGVGTSWGSGIAGYMFRVGDDPQAYVVSSVVNNTQLLLELAYGITTASGEDFSYWPQYYSPSSSDIGEIKALVGEVELREVSRGFLNRLDPERVSTGTPLYYSIFNKASALGVVSFEIWPASDDYYTLTLFYKKIVSDLSADSDTPVFRSEVLEAGALWDCYRQAFGVTQNPAFIGMARDAQTEFQGLMRQMIIEDLSTSSLPRRVRNGAELGGSPYWSNSFYTDHDVGVW